MKSASTVVADTANLTMESLVLPQELRWDGKVEPTSPSFSEPFTNTEPAGFWLHDDNFPDGLTMIKDDIFEQKFCMDISEELLSDDAFVDFYDLKKEWSDDKLPLLEVGSAISHPNPITKVNTTFDIGSLESGSLDSAVLTTLTPPQSPPQIVASPITLQSILPTEAVVNFNDVLLPTLSNQSHPLVVASASSLNNAPATTAAVLSESPLAEVTTAAPTPTQLSNFGFASYCGTAAGVGIGVGSQLPPSEIAHDDEDARCLQIVDEFLKSRVKELNEDCESLSSYSTPSRAESVITDEEWMPDSSFCSSASSSPTHVSGDDQGIQTTTATKKRTRPYGRGIEDRKIRKKEQNKNAATRYRQKKKLEMATVLSEEQQLMQRNDELKRILTERQREAKYLRTLIREFYKKKA